MNIIIPGVENGTTYYARQFPRNPRGRYQTEKSVVSVTPVEGIRLDSLPITSSVLNRIKIEESGVAQEFYVVRHNAYDTTRTQVLRRYVHSERQWHSSNVNTYATCTLDSWLNNDYFNILSAGIKELTIPVSIPYTVGNGNGNLGNILRRVFGLSAREMGWSTTTQLGYVNYEGTQLNLPQLAVATDSGGVAVDQYLRTARRDDKRLVCYVDTTGGVNINSLCTDIRGARPSFTLPGDLLLHPVPDADGCYIPIL